MTNEAFDLTKHLQNQHRASVMRVVVERLCDGKQLLTEVISVSTCMKIEIRSDIVYFDDLSLGLRVDEPINIIISRVEG